MALPALCRRAAAVCVKEIQLSVAHYSGLIDHPAGLSALAVVDRIRIQPKPSCMGKSGLLEVVPVSASFFFLFPAGARCSILMEVAEKSVVSDPLVILHDAVRAEVIVSVADLLAAGQHQTFLAGGVCGILLVYKVILLAVDLLETGPADTVCSKIVLAVVDRSPAGHHRACCDGRIQTVREEIHLPADLSPAGEHCAGVVLADRRIFAVSEVELLALDRRPAGHHSALCTLGLASAVPEIIGLSGDLLESHVSRAISADVIGLAI